MPSARVLIVEDEPDWQDILQTLLTEEGHQCRVAGSYAEAMECLSQETFNVVLLDMILHEFDKSVRQSSGWRLLDELVEHHRRTKIIVQSGRAKAGDVARLMRNYPITAFIEKGDEEMETQIREAVRQAIRAPALRIQTLGPFAIWRREPTSDVWQQVDGWENADARTLVKILLAQRVSSERAVAPDELLAWLWPNAADLNACRRQLLPTINSARHTLEPDIEPRDSNFILRGSTGYYFDLSGEVTWDVRDFRQFVQTADRRQLAGDWEGAVAAAESARALYRDDFMADDRSAPWAVHQRETLQIEYRDTLAHLAAAYAALKRYPEAIGAAQAALEVDPLQESVYRQLMRYHYHAGNQAQALKVYRDCEKLFGEMFGEGLAPQTRRLFETISAGAPLDDD